MRSDKIKMLCKDGFEKQSLGYSKNKWELYIKYEQPNEIFSDSTWSCVTSTCFLTLRVSFYFFPLLDKKTEVIKDTGDTFIETEPAL